ncbi:lysozyme inhibitor LprI family protein [Acidithiobacillus sulfuriphilus]|uniref:lysozyme inhibitor LprI family protein n=1 Tax=Acidithiobacillus sulfuriphilus TaxID=1867749 RepID=UPI003F61142E
MKIYPPRLFPTKGLIVVLLLTALWPALPAKADTLEVQTATLAQNIWRNPHDLQAVRALLVGQWRIIAAAGFMQDRPPQNDSLFRSFQELPNDFLGKIISFYPDRFDLALLPGIKVGTVCRGVSYEVKKRIYDEYEAPDNGYLGGSLETYSPEIRGDVVLRTWQGRKALSNADKHALQTFNDRGWINVTIETQCTEPGRKPDSSSIGFEISKGGMLSHYLVDGIFLLKKISDQPAAPGPGSLPKVGQGTGTIQTQKPAAACAQARSSTEKTICDQSTLKKLDTEMAAAYHHALTATAPNTPARKSLIDNQRRWLQTRDACQADVACIKKAYQERIQVLKGS